MNRRRFGRIRTPGLLARLQRGDEVLTGIPVENLSMGGAFLRTTRCFPVGVQLGVALLGPGKQQLTFAGLVVSIARAQPGKIVLPGVGLAFEPYAPEMAAALKDLLLSHAPGPLVLEGDGSAPARAPAQPPPVNTAAIARREKGPPPVLYPADAEGRSAIASARLAVQIKWLLLELADWRAQAALLASRNQALQEQVDRLLMAVAPAAGSNGGR